MAQQGVPSDLTRLFAAALDRLGPFEPRPCLAVAVSGGADSLALALLTRQWVAARDGTIRALVVDHGLRAASAAEAQQTVAVLTRLAIPAEQLVLRDLAPGPGLAQRARIARYAALTARCGALGILHLLLGHHAGDQAETVLMRQSAGSGQRGLAAMAALTESEHVRLLRPLLAVPPGRLRALLRHAGLTWIEDPSNRNPAALRTRLRMQLDDAAGEGAPITALVAAARQHGLARARDDAAIAMVLARRVRLNAAGFAVLSAGPIGRQALAALLRMLGGHVYPAPTAALASLAHTPRAATLAGVRLLPAGRQGGAGDWLLVREAAAMALPVAARPGAMWDGRFRLAADASPASGATLGALGSDAGGLRHLTGLPDAVLRTLPALRLDGGVQAVPHLGYPDAPSCAKLAVEFVPAEPLCGAPFAPA